MTKKTLLADRWYGQHLDNDVVQVGDYFNSKYKCWMISLSNKFFVIRGILLTFAVRKFDVFVTTYGKDFIVFLILNSIFGSKGRQIVLLEFIHANPKSKFKKALWLLFAKDILGKCMNKTVAKIHVLTSYERKHYSIKFGIPIEKFIYIPWPLHGSKQDYTNVEKLVQEYCNDFNCKSGFVMTSGRSNVDWETIFKVADLINWPFLVVCNSDDLKKVNWLNKNGRVKVLSEIPVKLHDWLVKQAAVYILCIQESIISMGQVRLMKAIDCGTPIVANKVQSLSEYIQDGTNAIVVPLGDEFSFKKEIELLFEDSAFRNNLIQSAQTFEPNRTSKTYLSIVRNLVEELL